MDVASASRVVSSAGGVADGMRGFRRCTPLGEDLVMLVRLADTRNWLRCEQLVENRKRIVAQSVGSVRRNRRAVWNGISDCEKKLWMGSSGLGTQVETQLPRTRFERARRVRDQKPLRVPMASFSLGSPNQGDEWESKLRSESEEVETNLRNAMTEEQVNKCLDGVPVYTVSNSANEFVVVSEMNSPESYGIICFRETDAEAFLSQIRSRDPSAGSDVRVTAIPLGKVLQLSSKEGETFRFVPDPNQIRNAYEVKARAGELSKAFEGVPVFQVHQQSESLTLNSINRRLLPIFFSKEDLETALQTAFEEQKRVDPALEFKPNIQVDSLEDILDMMEGSEEETQRAEIVFIPAGMDVFKYLTQFEGAIAR
ncbi:protein TIC 22, chloroplastic isoform X1 [Physcomitrium patens]|uniref:Protein TIC 22, chloroplastic n=1 Tax=Physcomitrium patens TaxID=3218 RepID=A0A7I4B4M4_PHYPA|nr:protein TIC 22, chloroplastic-like isoform X1 [Physcomitrium patens]|eukprot:XP_024398091.1 protein TIC 22, chloroplastic-like isoform X1 [Physcomitrella patens]